MCLLALNRVRKLTRRDKHAQYVSLLAKVDSLQSQCESELKSIHDNAMNFISDMEAMATLRNEEVLRKQVDVEGKEKEVGDLLARLLHRISYGLANSDVDSESDSDEGLNVEMM